MFWIVLGVFVVTNVIYLFTASGEVQPWNNPVYNPKRKEEEGKANSKSDKVEGNEPF